jgi:hypothetical protein
VPFRRLCWWLVDVLSRGLDEDERAATRGDLSEMGIRADRALVEVLGLVVRRQCGLWRHWRPWIALVTVAVPSGLLLGTLSRFWAEGSAAYLWLYATGAAVQRLQSTIWAAGDRDVAVFTLWFSLNAMTLVAWAWIAVAAMRAMARKAAATVLPAFWIVLALSTVGTTAIGGFAGSAPASGLSFGVVVPGLLRLCCVALPAMWSMMQDARVPASRHAHAVMAAIVLVLTIRAVPAMEISLLGGWASPVVHRGSWPSYVGAAAIAIWPAVYALSYTVAKSARVSMP